MCGGCLPRPQLRRAGEFSRAAGRPHHGHSGSAPARALPACLAQAGHDGVGRHRHRAAAQYPGRAQRRAAQRERRSGHGAGAAGRQGAGAAGQAGAARADADAGGLRPVLWRVGPGGQ